MKLKIITERYNNKWHLTLSEEASSKEWAILDHLLSHRGDSILCDTYSQRELLTTLGTMHNVEIEYAHPVKMKGVKS